MPRGEPSPTLSITMDPDVHRGLRDAAAADGMSVSAWLTEVTRRELSLRAGLQAMAEWEQENGRFTPEELATAYERVTGVSWSAPEHRTA